ncbi:hypothetical protein UABAM_06712 [Candidatus Uabimicrobium amorphum]|uniref:Uncharacterized protein n=2 Tax=Uabimicrobium amorphum TaxID=2596890 RepID=A0A5S9F7F1_UABAM|nr:hypothetical protein UABAM_06712 [Candidatus Uabimicrobium amorphum]
MTHYKKDIQRCISDSERKQKTMNAIAKITILLMCLVVTSCSTSAYVLGYNVWHEETQIPHPYGDDNRPDHPYYSPSANNIMYAETGFGNPVLSVLTLPLGVVFGPILLISGNIAGASEPKDVKESDKITPEELIDMYDKELNAQEQAQK